MLLKGSWSAGQKKPAFLLSAMVLIIALLAAGAALRLTRAAIIGGAYRADPFVRRILQFAAPGWVPVEGVDYRVASELASGDFRYPYRQALALWIRDPGEVPDRAETLLANELFREAMARAPSFASARYYYAVTALSLGDEEEADRNALAALRLAPLHQDIRKKVGAYFERRFRDTRSDTHLAAAFRAMGSDRESLIRTVLADPMISYDRVDRAFITARLSGEERINVLMSMGRWDWAIRAAGELDKSEECPGRYEGAVRLSYSTWLIGRGANEAALREALAGAAVLGSAFGEYSVLARALLLSGEVEAGMTALASALSGDTAVAEIESIFLEADLAPDIVAVFWEQRATEGERDVELLLALARAYIAAGRPIDARQTLKGLLEQNEAYAEANFLLARTFFLSGNRAMALRYARKSLAADPSNGEYASLMKSLEREQR